MRGPVNRSLACIGGIFWRGLCSGYAALDALDISPCVFTGMTNRITRARVRVWCDRVGGLSFTNSGGPCSGGLPRFRR